MVGDKLMGLLSVQSNDLTEDDIPHVVAFARHIGAAWWRAQLFEQAQQEIAERKAAELQIRQNAARDQARAEISDMIAEAGLDPQAVLDTIARSLADLIGDACVVTLLSGDGQWLQPVAFHHPEPEAVPFMRDLLASTPQRVGEGTVGWVAETGEPALIPDLPQDQIRATVKPEHLPYLDRFGMHSLLIVPLRAEGRVMGTVGLTRDKPSRPYTAEDQRFLQSIADRGALAIANARLFTDNMRQLKTLNALYAGAQKLSRSLNLKELAEDIVRDCVEVFDARLAWLGHAKPDGRVRVLTSFPTESEYPRLITVRWDESPQGRGPAGQAIRGGYPVTVADIASDPNAAYFREVALAEGFCNLAAFPLTSRGRTFGALALYGDQPDFFDEDAVEFFQSYAHLVSAALENARLFEEAQRRLQHMEALREIDRAITASLDLHITFNTILDQVTSQLGVDAADVLLFNPHAKTLEYATGSGFRSRALRHTSLRLGEGYAGQAALERRIIDVPDLQAAKDDLQQAPLLPEEDFIAYYGAPLIAKGQMKGVLEVFHRAPLDPDPEWVSFLETLARQTAIAIDNATLFDDLQRANTELILAYDTTLEGWAKALELRDHETEGHSRNVTEMTLRLARAVGMSDAELVHVRRGALLHDIGKMGIPDSILLKSGPLDDEEWDIMRQHPVYAYQLLSPIAYLRPALDIPYCHHEKWDGTGYPRGLKGEHIPLSARIFALVDVWDALRSDRPYRDAWPEEKALEHIREQAGEHFDPQVVEVFLELIMEDQAGEE
jgi:putative nucleotidyltransferase with HDIG domain